LFLILQNIKLLAIGKPIIKKLLIDEYCKRLSLYIKFDLEIIADIKREKFIGKQQKEKKKAI
jgi:23S rRNA (pseudouridine1915-N3)-methyltransferase